jgi:NosR/NirI family nitrous oxide reductase transcriptional regulator
MRIFLLILSILVATVPALGQQSASLAVISELFPNADHVGARIGTYPAQEVFSGDEVLGYVLYTDEVFPIPAYSGKPIRALIGVDMMGIVRGARIIQHEEPVLVIGISDSDLAQFINQYVGIKGHDRIKLGQQVRDGYQNFDGISGATITTMVLHRSIMQSLRLVMEEQQIGGVAAAIDESAPWIENWTEKKWQLIALGAGLLVLILILLIQDWLVVHGRAFKVIRLAFLIYTVVFLGFICLAQLSIINILTFGHVLAQGFRWDTFLVDPVIFGLWAFVAMSILLWGRGVYCGWLCPFGAIQELIHKCAKKLGVRQFEFPRVVHERLLAIKYVVLVTLIGISLNSIGTVATFVEVEPFKTVFSLSFNREWQFVLYPVILFILAIFNAKFYCKYICPLGAGLSFATNFRIFDWLRRRTECGSPCHTCSTECSVGAINSKGEILETECHYCLECQATYWDQHKCPVMVNQRQRRERREKRQEIIPTTTA